MKSRVFIASASSDDRMNIARAVANCLAQDYEVNPDLWPNIFSSGKYTLESLLIETRKADFAIFVLGPDDLVQKSKPDDPKGHYYVPRDNVIFELGLFIKALGKNRCFVLLPKTHPTLNLFTDSMGQNSATYESGLHLFTDFVGLGYATYESTKIPGTSLTDAVSTACVKIGETIKAKGARKRNKFRMFFLRKDAAATNQAVVIYPHIIVPEPGKIKFQIHFDQAENSSQSVSSTIKEELAHYEDLRAVGEIAELCRRMGLRVDVTRDGQELAMIEGSDTICFSIGTLNGCTVQVLKTIEVATNHQFELTNEFFKKKPNRTYFEDKTIEEGDVLFKLDGKAYPPKDESELNYAILVRILYNTSQVAPRFVCAGCDAFGTYAGGNYLKNHWEDLLRYYEDCQMDLNEDSLLVVLRFWGRKVVSADLRIEKLCFFNNKKHSTPQFYVLNNEGDPQKKPEKAYDCPYFRMCMQQYQEGKRKNDYCPEFPACVEEFITKEAADLKMKKRSSRPEDEEKKQPT